MRPLISIITAARNAAGTLRQTLASVAAQSYPHWEHIIVDNGSTDGTGDIIALAARRDPRIRGTRETKAGVCHARNHGIRLARGRWLLFLDADDSLHPEALARFLEPLEGDPRLDGVHGRWERVDPEGRSIPVAPYAVTGDIFHACVTTCVFPIHGCLIRRSRVVEAHGFDAALTAAEDMDLWQRIARTGARFGFVDKLTARYHMRRGSASNSAPRMAAHTTAVIDRGYQPDPRVKRPHPAHARGADPAGRAHARLCSLIWSAGIAIGSGEDPVPLLQLAEGLECPFFDPRSAVPLLDSLLLPECRHPDMLPDLWPAVQPMIERFLVELEQRLHIPNFARRAQGEMLRRVALQRSAANPATFGRIGTTAIEVTEPIRDLRFAVHADRAVLRVRLEGNELGILELPLVSGRLSAAVLRDAIANRWMWEILGRFFDVHLYPRLRLQKHGRMMQVWRDGLLLGARRSRDKVEPTRFMHQTIGWLALVQDLLDAPRSSGHDLFRGSIPTEVTRRTTTVGEYHVVELTAEPSHFETKHRWVTFLVMLGSSALTEVVVRAESGRIEPGRLRRQILGSVGRELAVVAVREALVGRSLRDQPDTLRARLLQVRPPRDLATEVSPESSAPVVLARRRGEFSPRLGEFPTSTLPAFDRLVCALRGCVDRDAPAAPAAVWLRPDLVPPTRPSGMHLFRADGWIGDEFQTVLRQIRDGMLTAIHGAPSGRVLELGCGRGQLTIRLARHFRSVVATDSQPNAIRLARARTRHIPHVEIAQIGVEAREASTDLDAVICHRIMFEDMGRDAFARLMAHVEKQVRLGGWLVVVEPRFADAAAQSAGFFPPESFQPIAVEETLRASSRFQLARTVEAPLFRILQFVLGERRPRVKRLVSSPAPAPPCPSPAERFETYSRGGLTGRRRLAWRHHGYTRQLPVLMYHQVAPTGDPRTARFRIHPEQFEEQLLTLRRLGMHTVSLRDWCEACRTNRALPFRAVVLTFDDGYRDFADHAAPLLLKHGFTATVFLVSGRIGRFNSWDSAISSPVPLMNWARIHQLHDEGFEFGSHTRTHPFLTTLPLEGMIEELALAREQLIAELGTCDAIAYPYGDIDDIVLHAAAAAGYNVGLTCEHGPAPIDQPLLRLPRIEIIATTSIDEFRRHVLPSPGEDALRARLLPLAGTMRHILPDRMFQAARRELMRLI